MLVDPPPDYINHLKYGLIIYPDFAKLGLKESYKFSHCDDSILSLYSASM